MAVWAARFRRAGNFPPTGSYEAAEPEARCPPERIGRYRIEKSLGRGAFGTVYQGYDDKLGRRVAIKVPNRHMPNSPEDVESYLAEARIVASLDHGNIVPVYDVGQTEDGLCYVVSKYIDGIDLACRQKDKPLSHHEAAQLVAVVAEALHHAHRKGVVHRDIKPSNLLLDCNGKPYVADFGLALKEQDLGKGPHFAGTLVYMSPEQARGEGHRVNGCSDIFSLGVVLYELLARRWPFWADSQEDLLERIISFEPRPPRQVDETIPRELERICLKALSKRATDRYTAAIDMAEDIRHYLAEKAAATPVAFSERPSGSPSATPSEPPASWSESHPIKIVPKGLRSFDAQDADFFLELLPGSRHRDGLPESIRFWKTRIEETDPDKSFAVGLIYGPSGCGKSSLVKAGLLPRLSDAVISVYVEATAEETEARLLRGLRRHCSQLAKNLGLKESLAALRRGLGAARGKKVLIVLDHFEQWLHVRAGQEHAELVEAFDTATVNRYSASLWSGTISGWRSAALCSSWRFG